jgi:hypothetical protein
MNEPILDISFFFTELYLGNSSEVEAAFHGYIDGV